METKLKITGNWSELKTKLNQKYPNLTDEDLAYSAGKEDELLARLTKKLGKTQEEINNMIDDLQSKNSERVNSDTESGQTENKQTKNQTESSKKY